MTNETLLYLINESFCNLIPTIGLCRVATVIYPKKHSNEKFSRSNVTTLLVLTSYQKLSIIILLLLTGNIMRCIVQNACEYYNYWLFAFLHWSYALHKSYIKLTYVCVVFKKNCLDISLDPPILDYSPNFRINSQKKLDPQSQLCLQCRQDYSIARRTTVCTQRRISSISVLLNQELLTNTNTNITSTIAKNQLNNLKIEELSVGLRKISLPDLRASRKSIMNINKEDLYSSSRICTYPLNPVSVSIQCGVRQNFLRNIFMENETSKWCVYNSLLILW